MKKFKFTLEAFYKVKDHEKTILTEELAFHVEELDRIGQRIIAVESEIKTGDADYQARAREGISAARAKIYGDYVAALINEKKMLRKEEEKQRLVVQEWREKVLRVTGELNIIEEKREEQYKEYLKEVAVAEEKTLEDFLSSRM